MKTHLIMPMCGAGSRFYKNGYIVPKPLIEIEGKPFFYWASRSILKYVEFVDITFVVLEEHVNIFNIDKIIKEYYPDAIIIVISKVTAGPVFTCLEGIRNIDDSFSLLFNDCDHMFKCNDLNNFLFTNEIVDGGLVTFESNNPHFSYVKYDDKKKIVGTIEKKTISNRAICGAYYFKSVELFKDVAVEYLNECPYKEAFLSGMYNVMCNRRMIIKDFLSDFHVDFGTPEEYETAKGSPYFEELK